MSLTTKEEEIFDAATAAFEELIENFLRDADDARIYGDRLEALAKKLALKLEQRVQAELVDAF